MAFIQKPKTNKPGEETQAETPLFGAQQQALGTSAAPQAAPKSGSGQFTNIQSYLQASRGRGAQGIQTGIAANVGKQEEKAKGAKTEAEAVASQVASEKERLTKAQEQIGQTSLANLQQNKDLLAQRFAGQEGIDRTAVEQQAATRLGELGQATQQLGTTQQMLGSELGRKQLISGLAQNPRYTSGQGLFDQLLLQSAGTDPIKQLQSQTKAALTPQQQALEQLTQGDTSIQSYLQSIYGTDKGGGLLAETQKAAEEKTRGLAGEVEGSLEKRAEAASQVRQSELAAVNRFLEEGILPDIDNPPAGMSKMDAAKLRFRLMEETGLKPNTQTYGLFGATTADQLRSGFNIGPAQIGKTQVATQQDVDTMKTLSDILKGGLQTDIKKAGTIDPVLQKAGTTFEDAYKQRSADILSKAFEAKRTWGHADSIPEYAERGMRDVGDAGYAKIDVNSAIYNLGKQLGTTDPQKILESLAADTKGAILGKTAASMMPGGKYVDSSKRSDTERAQWRANIDALKQFQEYLRQNIGTLSERVK